MEYPVGHNTQQGCVCSPVLPAFNKAGAAARRGNIRLHAVKPQAPSESGGPPTTEEKLGNSSKALMKAEEGEHWKTIKVKAKGMLNEVPSGEVIKDKRRRNSLLAVRMIKE